MSEVPRLYCAGNQLLRGTPVRHPEYAGTVFEAAAPHDLSPGVIRLCGVHQLGRAHVWAVCGVGPDLSGGHRGSAWAMAKQGRLVSRSRASVRLGQGPDASMGSVAG